MYQTQTFEISIVTLSFLRLFVLQCIKYEFSRQNQSAFVCQKVRDIQTFEILTMKRSKTCWHTLHEKIEIVLYLVRKLSSKCFLGAFTSFSGDKDLLLRVFSLLYCRTTHCVVAPTAIGCLGTLRKSIFHALLQKTRWSPVMQLFSTLFY